MNTEIVGRKGAYTVNVEGLDNLMAFLKESDPKMRKGLQAGLKDAGQPVLSKARANARNIARTGDFERSLSLRSGVKGALYLRSNDEAAGVIEFAKQGATYKPKATDKRRNARKMLRFPVGVPHRANPPRAMIPAVNDSVDIVRDRIAMRLEEVLKGAENG